jgi:hypothetical protein
VKLYHVLVLNIFEEQLMRIGVKQAKHHHSRKESSNGKDSSLVL